MSDGDHETRDYSQAASASLIRWRPWPCESCRGEATAIGHLVRSIGSSREVPEGGRNEQIDWRRRWEAEVLGKWVRGCQHTDWQEVRLPDLAQGSEHLVFFDEPAGEVVKVTHRGIYGDYYEIVEGRMTQYDCTPAEYLLRMRWWEKLFTMAPDPIGLTEAGQIASRQTYIDGDPPSQEAVDEFLTEAGLSPVKQNCWLWKKVETESQMEVWIGDARSDNFVSVSGAIVPIDIRVWGLPLPPEG